MSELKFDENGRLILPEIVKEDLEEQKRKEEEIKKFDKKLLLKFIGSEKEGFIRCEFEIDLPKDVGGIRKRIFEVKNWADKNVPLKEYARVWLEKNGDDYRLIISGKGRDERCTWCRSFRTALNKALFDLKIAIYQKDFCKFDKESYKKIKSEK